jgi:hypothetical protein
VGLQGMTEREQRAVIVKWMAYGYWALTEAERMVIAYRVTAGGCSSCGPWLRAGTSSH